MEILELFWGNQGGVSFLKIPAKIQRRTGGIFGDNKFFHPLAQSDQVTLSKLQDIHQI